MKRFGSGSHFWILADSLVCQVQNPEFHRSIARFLASYDIPAFEAQKMNDP